MILARIVFELATLAGGPLVPPRQCVHTVDAPRPRLTLAEQAHTRRAIRESVAEIGGSPAFGRMLEIVAARESSYQAGLVHRLAPDLAGAFAAWARSANLYADNPHYQDRSLWQTYGLFGMNSPIFTRLWHPQADPRVLCDPVVDVLVYRRAAANYLRRAGSVVECDGRKVRLEATWTALHRAVSGGKLCPGPIDGRFRRRAKAAGFDPDSPATIADLGRERAPGAVLLAQIWRRVDAIPAL